jgi:uncharacterized membrane protein YczE
VSSAIVEQSRPESGCRAPVDSGFRLPPLSRAGAIAAVLADGPMPTLLRRSARVGLLVAGSVVVAAGVAVMLWTRLGPGPLDVFIGAVRVRTGLSLTLAVWLVIASLIVSGLGAGSGELLASAASDRTGRPEPRIRMAFELVWLAVGVMLGGPIGVGTVLVALTIGPAVAVGYRAVDATAVSCRTRLGTAGGMHVAQPL